MSPPFTRTSLRKFQSPAAVAKLTASAAKITSCSAEQDLLVQQVGVWVGWVGRWVGWAGGGTVGRLASFGGVPFPF